MSDHLEAFESLIAAIEREVNALARATITSLEDELISDYALAQDQDMIRKRFIALSTEAGELLTILPGEISKRLHDFPYWVHRNHRFERLGEWSPASRLAIIYFLSRSRVADALKLEIAAVLGLFGQILFAHAFTAMPSVQVAELPVRTGLMFVLYNKECCYGREIELPESLLELLTDYCMLASGLADDKRVSDDKQRERNAIDLRNARDLARGR